MTDTAPATVAIRLVLSPTMATALDRITETTGMDRTNAIRAALVEWIDRHPAWGKPPATAPAQPDAAAGADAGTEGE